jgi:nucleotidyltransferase/DNA polymerase involved in DNA repair
MFVYGLSPVVLVSVLLPRFDLAVTLAARGVKTGNAPAALAPAEGAGTQIGTPNAVAAAAGVRAGMRTSEALALCPSLALHPADPLRVRAAGERLCVALEDVGAMVEPIEEGLVLLDERPLQRLLGGREGVLRTLAGAAAFAPGLRPRLGVAEGRFLVVLAARRARPERPLIIEPDRAQAFLDDLPIDALWPVAPELRRTLEDLGLRRLADLRALGRIVVRDRFGQRGEHAWLLAAGSDSSRLSPRIAAQAIREVLALPEPVATEQALAHALRLLLGRVLARPERNERAPRSMLLGARLAGGGSWERYVPLREATAVPERLELALAPRLRELPGPIDQLALELCALAPADLQTALFRPAGVERAERLAEAVQQVRAGVGPGAALRVTAADPTSRVPERRHGLREADAP